jgi:hypothetical protein
MNFRGRIGSGVEIEASGCGIRSTSASRQILAAKGIRAAAQSHEGPLLPRRMRGEFRIISARRCQ